MADSVGPALLAILDTLSPAERVAHVLHDVFGVPFAEIAPVVGRSSNATQMLASRARQRVRGGAPRPKQIMSARSPLARSPENSVKRKSNF